MNPPNQQIKEKNGPLTEGLDRIRRFVEHAFHHFISISTSRKEAVRNEIVDGSDPGFRYYLLMTIATLIAALGLVINSPAVIIGAMLISPLMGPILAIGLAIAIVDWDMLKRALKNFGIMVVVIVVVLKGLEKLCWLRYI